MILGLNGSGSLGDALWLTPIMKARKDIIVQMHPDQQSRDVSVVYNGLAQVEFTDNPAEKLYHINNEQTHYAQKALNQLGITEVNCLPEILLTKEEIEWGREFLKQYEDKKLLIILNDNSGHKDPTNIRARYVQPRASLMQQLVNNYIEKEGYTILQFGRKEDDRFTPLDNTIKIRGLNIRQLAACYALIGQIISSDTGDYHLMLSVGGKALVLVPPESKELGYVYKELHYTPELFKGETVRARYIDYTNGNFIYNYE